MGMLGAHMGKLCVYKGTLLWWATRPSFSLAGPHFYRHLQLSRVMFEDVRGGVPSRDLNGTI
jgi:hypothetical protein